MGGPFFLHLVALGTWYTGSSVHACCRLWARDWRCWEAPQPQKVSWRQRDPIPTSWSWHREPFHPGLPRSWPAPALPPPLASPSGRWCLQPSWPSPVRPRYSPGERGISCVGGDHLYCHTSPHPSTTFTGPELLGPKGPLLPGSGPHAHPSSVLDTSKNGRGDRSLHPPLRGKRRNPRA